MEDVHILAARLAAEPETMEPWPHLILDDFLPGWAFEELLDWLPPSDTVTRKYLSIPTRVADLLKDDAVASVIRNRYRFEGCYPNIDVTFRIQGLKPHPDRHDKPWSGLIYLAGDPVGTELYDAERRYHHTVEWRPNRLVAWGKRPKVEEHAVPDSQGRYVLTWWMLKQQGIRT